MAQNQYGNCPYHSSLKVCTESGLVATENCPHTKNVYGKGEYNWLFNNCMHKSAYYLSLCSIKKYNSEFKYRLKQARKYPSPNDAYRVMIYGIDPMNKVSIGTLVVKSR